MNNNDTRVMDTKLVWLIIFVFFIAPQFVSACPYCAGQDNKFSDILVPVAILLGSPFVVAGVFISIITKHNKKADSSR